MMRWIDLIQRYRTTTNVTGTILVGWLLSAIVGQTIGFLVPASKDFSGPSVAAVSEIDTLALARSNTQAIDYYMPICERNIFDSLKRSPCADEAAAGEEQPVQLDLNSPPVKSDIGAKLLGTMVSTNPNFSFGTIAPRGSGESQSYYIDDTLMDEAKIYDIQRNRVFFIRNGHREYIEVENLPSIYGSGPVVDSVPAPSAGEGIKHEGDKVIVARAKVDATLGDLNNIIQQARMVPHFEGGQVSGFKVFAIRPGSIFQELGLKNGDVIQRINGAEINTVEKAIPMLQLARTENSLTIDLNRRGQKQTLSIEIR
ncbi:MAG TPA: type II secretion system protein GspC [Bdellovibrionota bacterium]|nr:type II secretion system protein GspC [Bdellovibrionota bacterium]